MSFLTSKNLAAFVLLMLPQVGASISAKQAAEKHYQWVNQEWRETDDTKFVNIRAELVSRRKGMPIKDLVALANDRLADMKDEQSSHESLYKSTFIYLDARAFDSSYDPDLHASPRAAKLLQAWKAAKANKAYNFSRVGFIFIAGYSLETRLLDLGDRLLKKAPDDTFVYKGYITECFYFKQPIARHNKAVELGQILCKKYPQNPWNWQLNCFAHLGRGRFFKKRDDIEIAVEHQKKCVSLLKPGSKERSEAEKWVEKVRQIGENALRVTG